jgi:hypothetical protein
MACSESIEAQINYGLKLGMNISNIHLEESDYLSIEFSPRVGINAGIFGEYAPNHWFMIQLWMNYDQRGANFEEDGVESYESYHLEAKLSANYIEVPVLVKFMKPLSKTSHYKIYLALGPSFGYLINGRVKGVKHFDGEDIEVNEKIRSSTSKTNFGASFSLGLEFQAKNSPAFVEFRYLHGISNDYVTSIEYNIHDLGMKSRVFSISIGWIGLSDGSAHR